MKSKEYILTTLQDIKGANYSLLEDAIDVELQDEYFNCSRSLSGEVDTNAIIKSRNDIFEKEITVEEKKELFIRLASTGTVEAFRTIEKYINDPDQGLHDWAKLALQENRLLLESRILDQNQVLITSGLGGKGLNMRYFVVFIGRFGKVLTRLQQKIIRSELLFALAHSHGEPEQISFHQDICTATILVPFFIDTQVCLDRVVMECNELGGFLFQNFLLTNIKVLSTDEVREFISIHHNLLK